MLGCVILNYNDYLTTIKLLELIHGYSILDIIVVVDGKSTNDSFLRLKRYESSKIMVIQADKNGGYGYGNNVGIRICKELGMDYVLIANPDVVFTEEVIKRTLDIFKSNELCVAVSPRMKDREPAMRILSPWADVWASFICVNAILKPRNYPKSFYNGKRVVQVDVLPGSLVLFDLDKMLRCGLYDESVFLYHEEYIMGVKFKEKGYKSFVVIDSDYIHNHSVTVSKVFKNPVKSRKIVLESHKLYLRKYLHASSGVMLLFYILYPLKCAESFIWGTLKWIIGRKK